MPPTSPLALRACLATLILLGAAGCGPPDDDPWLSEAVARYRTEIAGRSREENRTVAAGLLAPLAKALDANDFGHAKLLALELQLVLESLNDRVEGVTTEPQSAPGGMRHVQRSGLGDRLRAAITGRSAAENASLARKDVDALRSALASGSLARARDLALEIRLLAASVERSERD